MAFCGGNIWVAIHGSNNLLANLLADHATQELVQALRRLGYTIETKPDLLAPGRG